MNQNPTGSAVVVTFLVFFMVANGSEASWLIKFRKLGATDDPTIKLPPEISPSPSPSSSPAPAPAASGLTTEKCTAAFKTCHYQNLINMTACWHDSSNANMKLVLVQNDGDNSLKVNVTINSTLSEIDISEHHSKTINVPDGESPSVMLNAGNGKCTIQLESPAPNNRFFKSLPYDMGHLTPIHGAYFLAFTALIVGGTWACCMLGKKGRQGDGVPYQEIEMGRPDSPLGNNVEMTDRWDQGWDDDWDQMKTVKSPRAHQNGNPSVNGNSLTSRSSDRDGWGNEWDD
ncbi:hypothetical protein UlMin_026218 [Ulmus minor]